MVSEFERDVQIVAPALDIVGIERFGVAATQNVTFPAKLTMVHTLPGSRHILVALGRRGVGEGRRFHTARSVIFCGKIAKLCRPAKHPRKKKKQTGLVVHGEHSTRPAAYEKF